MICQWLDHNTSSTSSAESRLRNISGAYWCPTSVKEKAGVQLKPYLVTEVNVGTHGWSPNGHAVLSTGMVKLSAYSVVEDKQGFSRRV